MNFITQDEEDVNALTLREFKESANYKAFIKNALPEINRAIQELTHLEKFEIQEKQVSLSEINRVNGFALVDISEYKKDIYKILRCEIVNSEYNLCFTSCQRLNKNTLKIYVGYEEDGYISIKYYPQPRLLTESDYNYVMYDDEYSNNAEDNSLDLEEIYVSDDMCTSVIPYLVKHQLWQDIEPELAQLNRSIGLQNASLLKDADEDYKQEEVAMSWHF